MRVANHSEVTCLETLIQILIQKNVIGTDIVDCALKMYDSLSVSVQRDQA